MKSGMVAAGVFDALGMAEPALEVNATPTDSSNPGCGTNFPGVHIRPSFRWGLFGGVLYPPSTPISCAVAPWTLHHHEDHKALKPAYAYTTIEYPKPDGKVSFDSCLPYSFPTPITERTNPAISRYETLAYRSRSIWPSTPAWSNATVRLGCMSSSKKVVTRITDQRLELRTPFKPVI